MICDADKKSRYEDNYLQQEYLLLRTSADYGLYLKDPCRFKC